MVEQKTFKVSQLPSISNLDENDLFMVSDYENGQCSTKKMTVKQLFELFVQKIIADPQMLTTINEAAKLAADEVLNAATISDKIVETIENNSSEILDILDGVKDNTLVLDSND